ncbi:MAG: hypothetical protein KDJ50_09235 [Alphaproteobacteria bacterium]|nr:hypothetical protein [Alphaproteobacteria bacterium]
MDTIFFILIAIMGGVGLYISYAILRHRHNASDIDCGEIEENIFDGYTRGGPLVKLLYWMAFIVFAGTLIYLFSDAVSQITSGHPEGNYHGYRLRGYGPIKTIGVIIIFLVACYYYFFGRKE